jgi:hypothetical protein
MLHYAHFYIKGGLRTFAASAKKADAQGISQFFCCANAANGGYDPITLPQSLLD